MDGSGGSGLKEPHLIYDSFCLQPNIANLINLTPCLLGKGRAERSTSGRNRRLGRTGIQALLKRQTNQRALIASRVMGLSIAFLSIAIAGLNMAKYFEPTVSATLENAGLLMGVGLVVILLGSFGLALRLSRRVPVM